MDPRVVLNATFCSVLILSASSPGANSSVEETLSLEQIARQAAEISVVRPTHAEPVLFSFDGAMHSCGFEYEAEVIERLKGSGRTTRFFASYELPLDQDHLVLLFPSAGDHARQLLTDNTPGLTELEKARQVCRWEASALFAWDDPRTAIRFSEAAAKQLGGRWLLLQQPTALLGHGLETRSAVAGDRSIEVVEWSQVKRLLDQAQ